MGRLKVDVKMLEEKEGKIEHEAVGVRKK